MRYYFLKNNTFTNSFISKINGESIIFSLDHWDDYGHRTTFYASYYESETMENSTFLGTIKIASPFDNKPKYWPGTNEFRASGDYKDTYRYLEANNLLNTPLLELQDSFYFLGDEDFYNKLMSIVPRSSFKLILRQLGDLALNDSKYTLDKVQNENVVINSFFRDTNIESVKVFQNIINQVDTYMPFSWSVNIWDTLNPGIEPINYIELSNDPKSLLPTNIFALVGNNGVGKTTLLKDIATAAIKQKGISSNFMFGSTLSFDRNIQNVVDLNQQHFEKITRALFITFSSFDRFDKDFVDLIAENTNLKFLSNRAYDTNWYEGSDIKNANPVIFPDYKGMNSLISTDELSDRMTLPLLEILKSTSKKERLLNALDEFAWDSNILNIKEIIAKVDLYPDIATYSSVSIPAELAVVLSRGSSGQKMILSMLIQIVSSALDNSLVLIDEPELYLHAPYVLALILAIEGILRETNSIGIITTHSAITLQEIPAKNIYTIKEINGEKKIGHPNIETFGANTGLINNELFNLDIRSTGYYKILSKIVETSTNEEIDRLIENNEYGNEATMLLTVLKGRKNV